MALTADQVYLLNTLGYLSTENAYDAKSDMTVGDFVRTLRNDPSKINAVQGDFQSPEQIKSVCDQILADDTLCSMTIEHASRTDGGADCLVITTPEGAGERQAVIVFEGTMGGNEWRDNFDGGARTDADDGVSTLEQEKALEWYQSEEIQAIVGDCDKVTVSGHSKGGNKAKYLTLLDDSIDECISFDGQGFSDEFVDEYSSEIMRNQRKITNYNASDDYVNILLNDVGEIHYIEGCEVPNFFTNHSLFTLYQSVPLEDHITEQNELMAEADQMLNSFLRSISQDEKKIILSLVGELAADLLIKGKIDWEDAKDYYDRLVNKGGLDVLGKFLDHLVTYASYELVERIISRLKEAFPFLSSWLNGMLKKVKEKGGMPDGSDLRLGNAADYINLDAEVLHTLANQLHQLNDELEHCAGTLNRTALDVNGAKIPLKLSLSIVFNLDALVTRITNRLIGDLLHKLGQDARHIGREASELSQRIRKVIQLMETTEKENIALIPEPGRSPSPFTL